MKKIFLLPILSLLMLSSCSSDDSVTVSEEKLTRKWYYKSYQANGTTDAYEHLPCAKDYVEFLANGTYIEYYITNCNPTSIGNSTGSWILEGSTVAVAIDGENYSGKVTKLTTTDLQLTLTADYDDDGDEEKVRVNFTSN
jgi:hypothetical protein